MTIDKSTQRAIEIIRRMDLKVAVPPKLQAPTQYYGDVTTYVDYETIHVPSLIDSLIFEIEQARREVADIKHATKILMGLKHEKDIV